MVVTDTGAPRALQSVRALATQASPRAWHIMTGEYPPAAGGVSGHSRVLAAALAAEGDEVHVWAPPAAPGLERDPGVHLHALPLGFGPRGLSVLARALERERKPRRILLQYVPQAFGVKGLNYPLCLWLAALRDTEVFVMFHEVALPWHPAREWKLNVAAAAMRGMAAILLARADRVFVSTTSWDETLRGLAIPRHWRGTTRLPVPSNVPVSFPDGTRAAVRARLGIDERTPLLGHFGTYGMTVPLLEPVLRDLLAASPRRVVLLMGRGSESFASQLRGAGDFAGRVHATGPLDPEQIGEHLVACDLMVQPFPDGVSTRRTSVMAGLALGVPITTNEGHLSEPLWRESGAVEIVDRPGALVQGAERLLGDQERARVVASRGRDLYAQRFSVACAVAALREAASHHA